MSDEFISQPIKPAPGSFDTARMATGSPGVPASFIWQGRTIAVGNVLKTWHATGPCTHGSGEMYVRRHYFEVETAEGIMTIYFDRQSKGGPQSVRWWLLSKRRV